MKIKPHLLFALSLLILLSPTGAFAGTKYGKHKSGLDSYPHMKDAIEALQSALKDKDPLADFQKAKKALHDAKANEGGHKADAIENIDEAIALLPGKDHDKIESKINAAIFYAHAAMKKA